MANRLLIVSPTPFLPSDAGNRVRIRNMIESIRRVGIDVFVLHVERERGDKQQMSESLGVGRFRSIGYAKPKRKESRMGRLRRQVLQVFSTDARHAVGVDDWYDPAITKAVLDWHEQERFSAVMVEYVFFSELFEYLPPSVLKILDTHDRFALRHRMYLERGMPPKFFSTTYQGEAKGLARADLILAIQDQEREFFSQMTGRRVVTLGHLVLIEDCFGPHVGVTGPNLLIVGSENEINVDGLNWFLREDWPALKAVLPGSHLLIAGGVGKHVPSDVLHAEDVQTLGFLENIEDAYRMADVVINPVRSGTGLNIKAIEALGYGKPMITTASGCRGIESGAGTIYLCAETPDDFTNALTQIWLSEDFSKGLSINALRFAENWNLNALASLSDVLVPRA